MRRSAKSRSLLVAILVAVCLAAGAAGCAGAAVVVLCGAAELGAAVAAGAVVAGWLAVVAVAAVALRLGRLLAALLIAPLTVLPAPAQPAAPTARQTATRIAAGRERLFAERRMSILPGYARRHGRGTREQWSAAAPCRGIIRGGVPCGEHRPTG